MIQKSQCRLELGHKTTVLMALTFCMLPGYILTEFRQWSTLTHKVVSSDDPVYITFDIDRLDPLCSWDRLVVGGLTTTQVLLILNLLEI